MPASFNNKPLLIEFLRAEGNVKYVPRQKSDYTLQTIATKLLTNISKRCFLNSIT